MLAQKGTVSAVDSICADASKHGIMLAQMDTVSVVDSMCADAHEIMGLVKRPETGNNKG